VAQILGDDYDIEIVETHHRNKDDAPSGTAKKLACSIAEVKKLNIDNVIKYGRVGKTGIRSNKEIGIHSVRGGDIPGECSLLFIKGETLEISYRAHSVEAFAQGAVLSLRFLSKKEKGFFEMKDVLNKQF